MGEGASRQGLGSIEGGVLVGGDQKKLFRAFIHQCLLGHVLSKARVFLMDVNLMRSIFESTLEWDEREEIHVPFNYMYIEPTQPLAGFEKDIVPTGFAFGRLENLTDIISTDFDSPLNPTVADFHGVIHGKYDWFSKLMARDEMSRHLAEDARCQVIGEDDKPTGKEVRQLAWYSARLMLYLSSSNIEWEVRERRYTGGSKKRKGNPQKSYYVTSFVKSRRGRLYDGEGGSVGSKLDKRVHVRGHFFRRWYCGTCDTTSAVKRFIQEKDCRDCGDPLSLGQAKVRRYWKPPHWKGPDSAEVAHRKFYRVRAGAGS
jgi:hypothetical protein